MPIISSVFTRKENIIIKVNFNFFLITPINAPSVRAEFYNIALLSHFPSSSFLKVFSIFTHLYNTQAN